MLNSTLDIWAQAAGDKGISVSWSVWLLCGSRREQECVKKRAELNTEPVHIAARLTCEPSKPAHASPSTDPAERSKGFSIAERSCCCLRSRPCCQRCQPERLTFAREPCDNAGKLQHGAHLQLANFLSARQGNKMFAYEYAASCQHYKTHLIKYTATQPSCLHGSSDT